MTTNEQRLQQQIENAFLEYMQAGRKLAMTALERALATTSSAPAKQAKAAAPRIGDASRVGKRRTASELSALSEQLYESLRPIPAKAWSS